MAARRVNPKSSKQLAFFAVLLGVVALLGAVGIASVLPKSAANSELQKAADKLEAIHQAKVDKVELDKKLAVEREVKLAAEREANQRESEEQARLERIRLEESRRIAAEEARVRTQARLEEERRSEQKRAEQASLRRADAEEKIERSFAEESKERKSLIEFLEAANERLHTVSYAISQLESQATGLRLDLSLGRGFGVPSGGIGYGRDQRLQYVQSELLTQTTERRELESSIRTAEIKLEGLSDRYDRLREQWRLSL